MKLYKVLDSEGRSCNGGNAAWDLPTKNKDGSWTAGAWMPKIEGDLELCSNGYHLCREDDLPFWLGDTIYEAEYRGEIVEDDEKVVVKEARLIKKCENWNEKTARLFACLCIRNTHLGDGSERTVWDLLTDERSKNAVKVSEKYAKGEATKEELRTAHKAARDAIRDATEAAMRAARWAAARAATDDTTEAAWAAREAVWAATEAAMRAAVGDAAWATSAAWVEQQRILINIIEGGDGRNNVNKSTEREQNF